MSKKIIALDAGHGLQTAGKRCLKSLDPNETREWYLNDRIMDMVEADLKAHYDCTVIRTDDTTGAKDISLSARCKTANQAGANAFVSCHHNAGLNGRRGGGTVVYYYSSSTVRGAQAQRLYAAVTGRTGLVGNRAQRIIKNGFYVLKNTNMPAFLLENGFMDSSDDVPVILSQEHARKTAEGIIAFLVKEYALPAKTAQETPTAPQTGSSGAGEVSAYYPAYTGAKTTLYNAMVSLGLDASYSHRKLIAKANGITGYIGTAAQNTQLYNLLVAGLLRKG